MNPEILSSCQRMATALAELIDAPVELEFDSKAPVASQLWVANMGTSEASGSGASWLLAEEAVIAITGRMLMMDEPGESVTEDMRYAFEEAVQVAVTAWNEEQPAASCFDVPRNELELRALSPDDIERTRASRGAALLPFGLRVNGLVYVSALMGRPDWLGVASTPNVLNQDAQVDLSATPRSRAAAGSETEMGDPCDVEAARQEDAAVILVDSGGQLRELLAQLMASGAIEFRRAPPESLADLDNDAAVLLLGPSPVSPRVADLRGSQVLMLSGR